jgi:hypothetical protein
MESGITKCCVSPLPSIAAMNESSGMGEAVVSRMSCLSIVGVTIELPESHSWTSGVVFAVPFADCLAIPMMVSFLR